MASSAPKARSFTTDSLLRHYKGGMYTVVGVCLIEATLQPGVLYKHLQGDMQDVMWMRPMSEFQEFLETAQGTVQRFILVSDGT